MKHFLSFILDMLSLFIFCPGDCLTISSGGSDNNGAVSGRIGRLNNSLHFSNNLRFKLLSLLFNSLCPFIDVGIGGALRLEGGGGGGGAFELGGGGGGGGAYELGGGGVGAFEIGGGGGGGGAFELGGGAFELGGDGVVVGAIGAGAVEDADPGRVATGS